MGKLLSLRLQQCFKPFAMLSVEGSPKTRLFRHFTNHVFRTRKFWKYISYDGHFFWKICKFNIDFKNAKKNSEKFFCFWDNCIWIGCVKLSLLRREYLPSALSVLGNSLEILHITNRNFLKVNCLHSDQ